MGVLRDPPGWLSAHKIEANPGEPVYIRTVRGEGYLFNPRRRGVKLSSRLSLTQQNALLLVAFLIAFELVGRRPTWPD